MDVAGNSAKDGVVRSSSRWLLLNHRPKHDRPAPGGVASSTSSTSPIPS